MTSEKNTQKKESNYCIFLGASFFFSWSKTSLWENIKRKLHTPKPLVGKLRLIIYNLEFDDKKELHMSLLFLHSFTGILDLGK